MNITIREPGSALTHFIAMLLALCAAVPLLVRAAVHSGVKSLTAMTVFMISMVLLYAASTIYHSVNCSVFMVQAHPIIHSTFQRRRICV